MNLQYLILGSQLAELTIQEMELAFKYLAEQILEEDLPTKLQRLGPEEWEFLEEVFSQLQEQLEGSRIH